MLPGALFLFIQHGAKGERILRRIRLGLIEILVALVKPLKRLKEPLARLYQRGTRHKPVTTAELKSKECLISAGVGLNWRATSEAVSSAKPIKSA